jgi:transposase
MAYSKDFRKRAIEYWENGHTKEELYEVFKIYPSRISAWQRLQKETGSLEPKYPKMRVQKIDLQELERALEENPGAYLRQLALQFNCTKQAVYSALKRLKITYKKNVYLRGKISKKAIFIFVDSYNFDNKIRR